MGTHAPLSDISADALINFETQVMTVPQYDPSHPEMISQAVSFVCSIKKIPAGACLLALCPVPSFQ